MQYKSLILFLVLICMTFIASLCVKELKYFLLSIFHVGLVSCYVLFPSKMYIFTFQKLSSKSL